MIGRATRLLESPSPETRDLAAAVIILAVLVMIAVAALVALVVVDATKSSDVADVAAAAISAISAIGGLLIGHRLGSRTARDAKRRAHAFETALASNGDLPAALDSLRTNDPDLR
jgi:hypothetical protein